MSYSQFDDSDIYLYLSIRGFYICDMCKMNDSRKSFISYSVDNLLTHLDEHKVAGHKADYEHIKARIENDVKENKGKRDTRRWSEFKHIKEFPEL